MEFLNRASCGGTHTHSQRIKDIWALVCAKLTHSNTQRLTGQPQLSIPNNKKQTRRQRKGVSVRGRSVERKLKAESVGDGEIKVTREIEEKERVGLRDRWSL